MPSPSSYFSADVEGIIVRALAVEITEVFEALGVERLRQAAALRRAPCSASREPGRSGGDGLPLAPWRNQRHPPRERRRSDPAGRGERSRTRGVSPGWDAGTLGDRLVAELPCIHFCRLNGAGSSRECSSTPLDLPAIEVCSSTIPLELLAPPVVGLVEVDLEERAGNAARRPARRRGASPGNPGEALRRVRLRRPSSVRRPSSLRAAGHVEEEPSGSAACAPAPRPRHLRRRPRACAASRLQCRRCRPRLQRLHGLPSSGGR